VRSKILFLFLIVIPESNFDRELEPKEAEFHMPWVRNPIRLKEDKRAAPPSLTNLLSNADANEKTESESIQESETFRDQPTYIVPMPDHYVHPRQTMEPKRITSISSSSVSVPPTSPFVPLRPTSNEKSKLPPLPVVPSRSASDDSKFVPLRSTSNSTSEAPPLPSILPRSDSQNGSPSQATILAAISSTPSGSLRPQRNAREAQPVDHPFTDCEVNHKGGLIPNANSTIPNYECVTVPWVLPSRKLHASRKPIDVQFTARMTDLRRQTNGTSSTNSTPQARQEPLLGSPVSLASSAFSQSFSVASLPPAVEFPPTPVFADQLPEEFMRKIGSLSVAQTPKASPPGNPHSFQNSTASPSPNSTPRQQSMKLPDSTGSVRRGYWNCRGDHLTPEGYLVFAPPNMQYPDDLKTYPLENVGYRDHTGLFTAYVPRRPELPQSLPKRGKPPEYPYESVRFFFR